MTTIGEALYNEAQERMRDSINERAFRQGWAIFDCAGSANSEYQLQKDDESGIFRDDDAVWEHVCAEAAKNPHGLEAEALEWLRLNCPDEYRYIQAAQPRGCLPLTPR